MGASKDITIMPVHSKWCLVMLNGSLAAGSTYFIGWLSYALGVEGDLA